MEVSQYQFDWPFFGNQHIIEFLQASIVNDKLAHCYIFTGLAEVGKSTVTKHFGATLLCDNLKKSGKLPCQECVSCRQVYKEIHSDVHYLQRQEDKKNISIDQVREFINIMRLGTFVGIYKIGIIKEADKLSDQAANALLKTLEESKKNIIIILLATELEKLPTTIVSRAQVLTFRSVAVNDINDYLVDCFSASRTDARDFANLSLSRPARAAKIFEDRGYLAEIRATTAELLNLFSADLKGKIKICSSLLAKTSKKDERKKAEEIIDLWQSVIRDLLIIAYGQEHLAANQHLLEKIKETSITIAELIEFNKNLEKTRLYLDASVNPKLALEQLYYQ
ncbi:MAG: hypothetical protein Q8Q23_04540 [bacterium]|nr:hypothetical protein [bacterium]